MAATNEQIESTADEVESKSKPRPTSMIQNVPVIVRILILVVVAGALLFSTQLNLSQNVKYIIIAILFVLLFLIGNNPTINKLLTEKQCVAIVNKHLLDMQNSGLMGGGYRRIPKGVIEISRWSILMPKEWGSNDYIYREFGFKVAARDGSNMIVGAIRINPYSGDIMRVADMPEGFTGREGPDRTYVAVDSISKSAWLRREITKLNYQSPPPPPNLDY